MPNDDARRVGQDHLRDRDADGRVVDMNVVGFDSSDFVEQERARDVAAVAERKGRYPSYDPTVYLPPYILRLLLTSDDVAVPDEPWEINPDAPAPVYEWGSRANAPVWNRDRSGEFWRLITRGEPNVCWSWRGSFARTTPTYSAYGRTHSAARWGWGLIHGVLPEDQAVRHSCENGGCMNPRHWYLSDRSPVTGTTRLDQFTNLDRDRFLGLHRAGAFSMRLLASTFGISERKAWSMVGLSATAVEKKTDGALWDAVRTAAVQDENARSAFVRDRLLVVERAKKAAAAAERKMERVARQATRAAEDEARRTEQEASNAKKRAILNAEDADVAALVEFEAKQPRLFCAQCAKSAPVVSTVDVSCTVQLGADVIPGSLFVQAQLHESCGWCLGLIRTEKFRFVSVPALEHRVHLRDSNHRGKIVCTAAPAFHAVGTTGWRHGIRISFGLTCNCGVRHAWDVSRWTAETRPRAKRIRAPVCVRCRQKVTAGSEADHDKCPINQPTGETQ